MFLCAKVENFYTAAVAIVQNLKNDNKVGYRLDNSAQKEGKWLALSDEVDGFCDITYSP